MTTASSFMSVFVRILLMSTSFSGWGASIAAGRRDAAAADVLDREQRLISEREQRLEVARVVWIGRDAEARREASRPTHAGEIARLADAHLDLPRLAERPCARDARQHDDEFVPGIGDRPRRRLETAANARGHLLDRTTAVQVSARVDEPLEAIEIEEQDRERRARCSARLDQLLERLIEIAGVVEAREIVVHRELAEPLLVRAQRILGAL